MSELSQWEAFTILNGHPVLIFSSTRNLLWYLLLTSTLSRRYQILVLLDPVCCAAVAVEGGGCGGGGVGSSCPVNPKFVSDRRLNILFQSHILYNKILILEILEMKNLPV